jgi:hypothetical protein
MRVPEFDPAAVARAEAALEALGSVFPDWMHEEVLRLEDALLTARTGAFAPDSLGGLQARAHDVKGMAATYRYPLASRIADCICRLLATPERCALARANRALLEAAVAAVRACVRENIRDETDRMGAALAKELDARVTEALAGTAAP